MKKKISSTLILFLLLLTSFAYSETPSFEPPILSAEYAYKIMTELVQARSIDANEFEISGPDYMYDQRSWRMFYFGKEASPGNHFGVTLKDEEGAVPVFHEGR